MLNIFAQTFMTATRQDPQSRTREQARRENPLYRVRSGGLIVEPDKTSDR
ncbi:hypothetical protein [Palleronia abyssalis]|uniref:Uncharacterized protein n=1 Tax=Palleronia abyssalis TaxID=1501240 RepID=A0A2R8BSR8_9RHOB|nr:hypothetical protein [Palleronia abyssalis]SPJ23202.1 hypothetical protein PAA8504_01007 [Palleronia abyssalis]